MKKKTIVIICVIAFTVICAGIIFFPVLQTEKVEEAIGRLHWTVSFAKDLKTGQYYDFDVRFFCMGDRKKISGAEYSVGDDGTVDLSLTERGIPLFFPKNDDGYHVAIPGVHDEDAANSASGIRRIVLNTEKEKVVIWEDGVEIDGWTSRLFNEAARKNADPASVAETVLVMLSADSIISNDSQEGLPFELTLSVDGSEITGNYIRDIIAFDTEKDVLWELKMDSCYLLALLDGLEKVNWKYSFEGKRDAFSFSAAQASEALGQAVKAYGKTAGALQKLTDLQSTYPPVYFD